MTEREPAAETAAPSGTVTFLFSDIEGSTQRWDRYRAPMQAAVRRHDEILREAIAAHGGYVFKTIGDAFRAAFAVPEAAVNAAIAAQRALEATDFSAVDGLRVRMAVHTGTADARAGDYAGPAIERVARLLSAGHGGQVLLSGVSADLVRHDLPAEVGLLDLGVHELQDGAGEERVKQLVVAGLRAEFPALRAHRFAERPWLVPDAMRTRYFTGRDELLERVRKHVVERGRTALSGLGGAGKTQSAMEYAVRYREHYSDGVFWINAETTSGLNDGFVGIAESLRLTDAAASDQSRAARATLDWLNRSDRWLLIFDNVSDRRELAPFVPESGRGHVLITSRETVFQEIGIPRALDVGDLSRDEAVDFLLARTGREECASSERAAAAALAEALGCLPLALEQAAAYVAETAASFEAYLRAFEKRRLAVLERSGEFVSRETVAVTWAPNFAAVERASPESAEVLRLCAFLAPDAIPFALFANFADDELGMVELLRPLTRYSLVRSDNSTQTFGLHRLVQDTVRDALGDERCAGYAERAVALVDAGFRSDDFPAWPTCERLVPHALAAAEAASAYAVRSEVVARLLNKTGRYLARRGRYVEAEALSRKALALARDFGGDQIEVANALANLGIVMVTQGRLAEAEPHYVEALALRERLLGPVHDQVTVTLMNFGNLYLHLGRYAEAWALYERALSAVRRQHGEVHGFSGTIYNNMARIRELTGRYAEAFELDLRARDVRERFFGPEHPHVALSLSMLGNGHARRGEYAEALALQQRALALRERALGADHDEVAESLCDLASLYVKLGRFAEAKELHERSLAITEGVLGPDHQQVAQNLAGLGRLAVAEGRAEEAEPLLERALAIREALGRDHVYVAESLIDVAALDARLGRRDAAVAALERALAIKTAAFPEDHPELGELRDELERLRGASP